ncbi:hypothetical protein K504DRAFT_61251 [Pleomassaria siparia CBS 279.74]|uniref:Uncharacterized protein n=1 Tax=Pleomassaria siparia CBS 279.74 TaxID=1314801 RepID=A0A6G1K287_9PLEO|nr:hypothetical protein K504DRAFT_61251 [Pleomassaria siparia CBS 279.74]
MGSIDGPGACCTSASKCWRMYWHLCWLSHFLTSHSLTHTHTLSLSLLSCCWLLLAVVGCTGCNNTGHVRLMVLSECPRRSCAAAAVCTASLWGGCSAALNAFRGSS